MKVELILGLVCVARVANGKPYEDGRGDEWARFLKHRELRRGREHAIAAGGLYSTVADVMKFYLMLANDGKAPDGTRILSHASILELSRAQYPQLDRYTLGLRQFGDWFGHDGALQTEAYANWKENRAALLFVQVTGCWDHRFKLDWRTTVFRRSMFRDGDRVIFFGDSITHGGRYHEFLADYYYTRFPDADIWFVNSGIGGDNAKSSQFRIPEDIVEYAPTHVCVHFGMNDVGRTVYSSRPTADDLVIAEKCQAEYRRNLPELVSKIRRAVPEARLLYLTPTPYDDTADVANIPPGKTDWSVVNNKG